MNLRFVLRGLLLAVPLTLVLLAGWVWLQTPWARPLDPTPPPPTILAPPGDLPPGPLGFEEWVRYDGEEYRLAGSGFFLLLPGGQVVSATAAHTVNFETQGPLKAVALGLAGGHELAAECDTAWGLPGHMFRGSDLSVDYLLLRVDGPLAGNLALPPDPRGGPQPGERVWLASGLGDGQGGRSLLGGTVQTASAEAVWVVMDGLFDPSLMSGSPVLSQHTGQVVGMALAASPRRGRLLVGAHPIGSLLHLAQAADGFRPLADLPASQPGGQPARE